MEKELLEAIADHNTSGALEPLLYGPLTVVPGYMKDDTETPAVYFIKREAGGWTVARTNSTSGEREHRDFESNDPEEAVIWGFEI